MVPKSLCKKVPFYHGEMRDFNDASVTSEFVLRPKTGYPTIYADRETVALLIAELY